MAPVFLLYVFIIGPMSQKVNHFQRPAKSLIFNDFFPVYLC